MQKLDAFIDEHGGTPKAPEQTTGKTRDGGGVTSNDIPVGYSLTTAIDTTGYITSTYPWGQCTWYVFNRGKQVGVNFDPFMGNGGQWMNKQGFTTTHTPTEHSALSLALDKLELIQYTDIFRLWNKLNQTARSWSQNVMLRD